MSNHNYPPQQPGYNYPPASNPAYPPPQGQHPQYPPNQQVPPTHYQPSYYAPPQGGGADHSAYASYQQPSPQQRPAANSFVQQPQQQQQPNRSAANSFSQPQYSPSNQHQGYNSTSPSSSMMASSTNSGYPAAQQQQMQPTYAQPQQATTTPAPRRTGFEQQITRPTLPKVDAVTNKMRIEAAALAAPHFKKRLEETFDVDARAIIKDEILGKAHREEETCKNFAAAKGRMSRTASMIEAGGGDAALPLIESSTDPAPLTAQGSADSISLDSPKPSSMKIATDNDVKTASSRKRDSVPVMDAAEAEQIVLAARGEHNYALYSLLSSVSDHKDELGAGIVYYFEFMKFLIGVCTVYTVLQIIQYVIFVKQDNPGFDSTTNPEYNTTRRWFDDFSITGYSSGLKPLWLGMNIFAIVVTFASCPLYYGIMKWKRNREGKVSQLADGKSIKRDRLLRIDNNTGLFDVSFHYRSSSALLIRRIAAFAIVVAFLSGQVLSSYYLTKYPKSSMGISFAIALLTTILNTFFRTMASKITEMTKPHTYEAWKKLHTTMLMTIRMGNLITVYAAKDYDSSADIRCTYDLIGEQFIMLLLVEIIITNVSTLATSMLRNHYAAYIAVKTKSKYGDRDNLPNFDIAFNYLNLLYRLYIALMAMVVTPMTICLSLVGFALQFWLEKFLLFKICGRPKKVYSSQKNFLSVLLALIAVASIATPFAGSGWIMSGYTGSISPELCPFP